MEDVNAVNNSCTHACTLALTHDHLVCSSPNKSDILAAVHSPSSVDDSSI